MNPSPGLCKLQGKPLSIFVCFQCTTAGLQSSGKRLGSAYATRNPKGNLCLRVGSTSVFVQTKIPSPMFLLSVQMAFIGCHCFGFLLFYEKDVN